MGRQSAQNFSDVKRLGKPRAGASRTQKQAFLSTRRSVVELLGLEKEEDLLLNLPIRYEDETYIAPIGRLIVGMTAQVEGVIRRSEVLAKPRRMWILELQDETGVLLLRFVHFYVSGQKIFTVGRRVRALGVVRLGFHQIEMVHPRCRIIDGPTPLPDKLTPVYSTVRGLSQFRIRAAVRGAMAKYCYKETLPKEWTNRLGLPSLQQALQQIHAPSSGTDNEQLNERRTPAWRRVILDELLAQQLSLFWARRQRCRQMAPCLTDTREETRFLEQLPFQLTLAQKNAWEEIHADLSKSRPMHRLLQGDVGSGKTIVAVLAALRAISSGWQAVLMVPTEILAQQHLRTLTALVGRLGIRLESLCGSHTTRQKQAVREEVAMGTVQVLIGTHAVIEESVVFQRLGLVIVDEQHRFGVAQRLLLRSKALVSEGAGALSREEGNVAGRTDVSSTITQEIPNQLDQSGTCQVVPAFVPHQLMLSATPIPRTLAMSKLADIDVSTINALPPGRSAITTKLVSAERRAEVMERVRGAAQKGRQVYWVCPLVASSEVLDLQNAQDTYDQLLQLIPDMAIRLVHGRMPASEKQSVMADFSAGEVRILVATTVVEVGVDVPNASLMVVENAERFGLAQLHQLRGRVGRGGEVSTCILMYSAPLSPAAAERLRALYETQDGFEIARRDLAQRGPGEFLGLRQSGQDTTRFADAERDSDLIPVAKALAEQVWQEQDRATLEQCLNRWFPGATGFFDV